MKLRFWLFFLVFFVGATSYGQVVLDGSKEEQVIGNEIFIFNAQDDFGFDSLLSNNFYDLSNLAIPNIGIQKGPVWLKFEVSNISNHTDYLLTVAYPILDSISLYRFNKATGSLDLLVQTGEAFPFGSRKYKTPDFIFDINVPKDSTHTYFLKIKSIEQLIIPISISTSQILWQNIGLENTLSGIFFGIVLIMFFYNLFLYFSTKEKGYIFYVVYVAFAGFTQLGIKGYTFQLLWPTAVNFQSVSLILFASISSVSALLFAVEFLKLKQNAPFAKRFIDVLFWVFAFSVLLAMLGFKQLGFQLMLLATSIGSVSVIVISFLVMYKGYKPAQYFFAAWSVLLVGSLIFLLKDYGILPYNLFTSYSVQGASAIEMALLSFGLANSINVLKREKEDSQAQALAIAQENERIIRGQNVFLEEKVAERTTELIATNDDLKQTLAELKQTQSQLVESEKMASLGQLTAGIAHEINNPINFVTSNVTPLKRDVKMVFETIDFIESLSYSELPAEEKKQKIATFKEELDYDYLKIEIDHLLNGIYEGSSRTAEIVKGLRIFSRVDENDLKKANIHEGLDSTLVIINNQLNGTIKIAKEYTASLPVIECYPGKLNQVFLNIITNAIHAVKTRHKESGNGLITIKTAAQADTITVEIRDNGIGMDEQTQKKIYEPFFTTKDVGEGTGLGMSIVYNTVKKHNGTIQLVSRLGEGTSFLITLPKIANQ